MEPRGEILFLTVLLRNLCGFLAMQDHLSINSGVENPTSLQTGLVSVTFWFWALLLGDVGSPRWAPCCEDVPWQLVTAVPWSSLPQKSSSVSPHLTRSPDQTFSSPQKSLFQASNSLLAAHGEDVRDKLWLRTGMGLQDRG